jgi:TetR/AcrR family transcriptional regulator
MEDEAPGALPQRRARNPAATRRDILVAARAEFVEHGLDGARVDRIAARAGANKRLIYAYVGNKEELYGEVMLEAYRDIRQREEALHMGQLPPVEAMTALVGFTFDHFEANPWFIRLLAIENLHRAAFISGRSEVHELTSPIIRQLNQVLADGVARGLFRTGVDPVQLYLTIIGLSYFYFSNIHTLSVVVNRPLVSAEQKAERRAHVVEVVLDYLARPDRPA